MRDRILERLDVQTEPEHVERAPRRERWKRQAWMAGSTFLSFGIVFAGLQIIDLLLAGFPPTGYAGIAVAIVSIGAALAIDILWVFPWGFDRSELVAPWEFREAGGSGSGERGQAAVEPIPIYLFMTLVLGTIVAYEVVGRVF